METSTKTTKFSSPSFIFTREKTLATRLLCHREISHFSQHAETRSTGQCQAPQIPSSKSNFFFVKVSLQGATSLCLSLEKRQRLHHWRLANGTNLPFPLAEDFFVSALLLCRRNGVLTFLLLRRSFLATKISRRCLCPLAEELLR